MAQKPTLSREYMYVGLADLNVDINNLSVNAFAFKNAGVEPEEADWITAIVVDDTHPLFVASIGEALALLIGPTRGDAVTTETLGVGDHQVWVDAAVTGSDERVVRVAGTVSVSATGS